MSPLVAPSSDKRPRMRREKEQYKKDGFSSIHLPLRCDFSRKRTFGQATVPGPAANYIKRAFFENAHRFILAFRVAPAFDLSCEVFQERGVCDSGKIAAP